MTSIDSGAWNKIEAAGLLQACVSYPLVLDVLELVGQLQLELLEVTSEEEERAPGWSGSGSVEFDIDMTWYSALGK